MADIVDKVFIANGTEADKALLMAALRRIHFPWEVLLPSLKQAGLTAITLEFADLSGYGALLETVQGERLQQVSLMSEAEDHVHDEGESHTDILWSDQLAGNANEPLHYVAGLAWHGKLQIEQRLKTDVNMVGLVVSSEVAHETDFFYVSTTGGGDALGSMHDQLLKLTGDPLPWNHGVYSEAYYTLGLENFMAGFGIAYGDGPEDHRFAHWYTKAQAPAIRQILKLERTDAAALPPPILPPQDALAMAREVIVRTNAERAKAGALPLVLRPLSNGTLPAGQEISWTCMEGRLARIEQQIGSEIPLAAMGALVEHSALMKAAADFAAEMVRTGKLDHTGEGGTSPGDRMAKAGYKNFTTWGENIARGFSTPEAVMLAWMNSAGHRANILNPAFVHVGVGYQAGVWAMDLAAGDSGSTGGGGSTGEIKLTKLTPDQGAAGTTVTAAGQGFGTAPSVIVTIATSRGTTTYRLPEAQITQRSDTSVTFKMPINVATGAVYLRNGLNTSNSLTFTVGTSPPPPPPTDGKYQLVLTVKATQTAAGWDWTSGIETTASAGLDVNEAKAALIRQGIAALQKVLEGLT